jgi:hypothetical protein
MFHSEQCGSCVGICLLFVNRGWHLSAPLAVCSQLKLVSSVFRHGAIYFSAHVFLYDTYVKYGSARKCRRKFRRKFHDKKVPSRQTISNLVNKLGSTGLLKKQKHARRVLTEELP